MRLGRRTIGAAIATVALVAGAAASGAAPASALPGGATPSWPDSPDWHKYVQSPDSTDVKPVSIVSVSGDVTNAEALIGSGNGVTTLTATPQSISPSPVTLTFPQVQSRYVRLDVSKLGLPAAGDPAGVYVQLAEVQVFGDDDTDLAAGQPATASETLEVAGWSINHLTDGVTDTEDDDAKGWTSSAHGSPDLGADSVYVTIDLGSIQAVSSVVLWPRTDTLSPDGHTASFPVDYTVVTSDTDDQPGSFVVQKTVTGQETPPAPVVPEDASIVLDYGQNVGGYPTFDVSAVDGTPTLLAGYSETRLQVSPTGDGVPPWASGDAKRYNRYNVTKTGRITNGEIQGGQRYQMITLEGSGSVSLSAVGIDYTPLIVAPEDYAGHFVSSSDELNKYWYGGVYTNLINHVPVNSVGARWNVAEGALDVPGTTAGTGLLREGMDWTDYTVTFDTKIVANQAGWMVRGTDPMSGYVMIVGAADNAADGGGPNVLQQLTVEDGDYKLIANTPLTTPIESGTWHTIKEVVSGTTVTTFIDDIEIATFDSDSFGSDMSVHNAGTVGFRQFSGEEAMFRNLSVTSSGATLYDNALSDAGAIDDFTVPGNNTVPLLLDGAKRDRAVWSGDLVVQGPNAYYSTGTADYMRGSLELLGSWAGTNGYVSGMMSPTTPINTEPQANPRSPYSAGYSMYFVRSLAEYYEYTADADFVIDQWPTVARQLEWNESLVGPNGLIVTDNTNGADWDYYDGDKIGEVTTYNALYYKILLDGAELAKVAGEPALASEYTDRAVQVKDAINERLFNAETGVYNLSDTVTDVIAQDANIFAILYGIAPEDKVPGILTAIKSDLWTDFGTLPFSGNYQQTISPFISGFELNARFEAGDTDNALQLLSNLWGPMIAPGDLYTGTFWENLSTEGTQATGYTNMAHGWAAMPTTSLSKYVLGIRPVAAGYKTWSVKPHTGDLEWTKGEAPTPHGPLVVNWSRDPDTGFAMHVEAPAETSGTISVPTFGVDVDLEVNGQTVWSHGQSVAGGQVESVTLDGDYLTLAVTAGTYDISTGPAQPMLDQSITFDAIADKSVGDADFTVSASASSGLPVFFSADGTCTVTGGTVHLTGAGTCTITASQAGNADYSAAPDVSRAFDVADAGGSQDDTTGEGSNGAGDNADDAGATDDDGGSLSATGANVLGSLGAVVLLVAIGSMLLITVRRRRAHE